MDRRGASLFLALLLLVSAALAEEEPTMLEKADRLKHAGQYEAAVEVYEAILAEDPQNAEALQGRDDCRVMLEPIIPVQALMVPPAYADQEYRALVERLDRATTPWDKKRAEIALDRFGMKYTGEVFTKDSERLRREVDTILGRVFAGTAEGRPPEDLWWEADRELRALQEGADRSWKGHGPELLDDALAKLSDFYRSHDYPNPGEPLVLSVLPSAPPGTPSETAPLSVTIANHSETPVLLIHLRFLAQEESSIDFGRSRPGRLSYEAEKNRYRFETLEGDESEPIFSEGLVLAGGSIQMEFPRGAAGPVEVRFLLLDEETMKGVYFRTAREGAAEFYHPISPEKMARYTESASFYPDGEIAPIYLPVIVSDDARPLRVQRLVFAE